MFHRCRLDLASSLPELAPVWWLSVPRDGFPRKVLLPGLTVDDNLRVAGYA
jgi:hypothetical protein